MTLKTATKSIDVDQVPSVKNFINEQTRLFEFMRQHDDVFEAYGALCDSYNAALEEAEKTIKAMCDESTVPEGVSCGPFEFKHFAPKYDPDKLYRVVSEAEFRALGGSSATVVIRQLDKPLIESLIERGQIPAETRRKFVTLAPNYDKPKKVSLP